MLVGTRKGGKMPWYDESKKIENVIRPGDYGIKKIIPSKSQHPTQKPVALFEHFIRLHTKPGDLVVDPFAGSGSSGVAAKKLGRRWIGCDTDERWVKMARERLAATTPPLPGLEDEE
jgi:DNA modification methylase